MSHEPDAPPQSGQTKPVVLVVEDEPMVGEVVCAMLRMGGFESILARNPEDALRTLKDASRHLDLLLTDHRMPEMTGMELIERSGSLRPRLKTVLYSGDADEFVVASARRRPDFFLRKPFTPNVLNELVIRLLAG
jgi:DNA-binding NtrC family response regulator